MIQKVSQHGSKVSQFFPLAQRYTDLYFINFFQPPGQTNSENKHTKHEIPKGSQDLPAFIDHSQSELQPFPLCANRNTKIFTLFTQLSTHIFLKTWPNVTLANSLEQNGYYMDKNPLYETLHESNNCSNSNLIFRKNRRVKCSNRIFSTSLLVINFPLSLCRQW